MSKKKKKDKEPVVWKEDWVNPLCSLGLKISCGCNSPDCDLVSFKGKLYCTMHLADFRSGAVLLY